MKLFVFVRFLVGYRFQNNILPKVAAGRRVIELEDKLAEQEQELFELQKEVGRSRLIESLRAGTFFKGMFLFSIIFQVSQISLRSNMV